MGNHAKHSTADLASGDHLCILYETEEERNSALAEYFRCGLDRNEKILYVTDHHDGRRISSCLNESGLDIEGALIKGQIKIIDIGTTKCPDEILELMRSEAKGPLEEDCSVLRIAVEMISSDCIKAAEYEAKIADFIRRIGCLTLCLYNQPRFDPSTIMDVLRAHPLVMVGAEVCKNLYYIPPGDQGRDSDSAMVLHAKESLLEHRHAEVRAQESEKKLREIIERSIDAVVMTDRQGRITYV
ncbi:MAG TPA: MEDS domain-containing protein, partial [Methanotrichaceae archaeon]|nr:MEDS domain-containing protein [Methanotrichaceae archaeon]